MLPGLFGMAKTMLDLRDKQVRFRMERTSTFQRKSERSAPLRTRKRKARFIAATIILFFIAATTFGITWLAHYERFLIDTITVEGVRDIHAESVQQYVNSKIDDSSWRFISQKNIFYFDQTAIVQGLERDMPRIRSVKLSRPSRFSQNLIVSIEERQPAALWCETSGACYEMDDSGFIYEEASTLSVTTYSFDGGVATSSSPVGQTFASGYMSELLSLLEALRKSGFTSSGVSVDSDTDFRVHLIKGYNLKISFGVDPNKLVSDLQLVLSSDVLKGEEQNLEYVDLRFGNRIYFKLKGEGASQASSQ